MINTIKAMATRQKAAGINEKARKLQERGEVKEAIELYREASAIDPGWAVPLYNLGLLFKNEHKWDESLKYNQLATARDATNEAAWWNLGIAATALGDWKSARSAW